MTNTNATLIPQGWIRTPCTKLTVEQDGDQIVLLVGNLIAVNMSLATARELVRALGRAGIWSDQIIPVMPNEEPDDPIGTENPAVPWGSLYDPKGLPF